MSDRPARARGTRWLVAVIGGPLLSWRVLGYRSTGHHECFDCKTWVRFDRRGLGSPGGACKLSIRGTRADYGPAIDQGARLMKECADSGRGTVLEREWRMWPEK